MPTEDTAALFQPFRIKSLDLKNRIVMAPMARRFAHAGVPGPDVAAYYRRRAQADVGLILSESTVIDRPGTSNDLDSPFFHGEAALAGWKRVVDEVHAGGGRMGPQLWHTGSQTSWLRAVPESPSGLVAPGLPHGVAMTEEDLTDTIEAFGRAAAEAKRLGFDVVEIHGAHGYLIDQFFWSGTNKRIDRFGGATLKERSRFAVEVVRRTRAAVGPDFPILFRLSQWKLQDYSVRLAETPDAMADWLTPLAEAGVDVFDCSQRRFWEPEFPEIDGKCGLNFAGWAKKLTAIPTISVGSVGLKEDFANSFHGRNVPVASLDELLRRLEREEFDLIAVGRALLGDPRWAAKIRSGDVAGLRAFSRDSLAMLS